MGTWNRKDAWIAVFDILGFRELLRNTDQELPRRLLTSRLEDLDRVLEAAPTEAGIEYLRYSDTFVLWTPDLEPRCYPWLLHICESFITKSIYVGLPIQGAISAGPFCFSTDPPRFMGSAFLEAHEYCEDQDCIGLLLTPSATQLLRKSGLEPLRHDFVSGPLHLRTKKKCADDVLTYRFQNGSANFTSPLRPHLNQMQHRAPQTAKQKYQNTASSIDRHYRQTDGLKTANCCKVTGEGPHASTVNGTSPRSLRRPGDS